jgi:hypothetical protein
MAPPSQVAEFLGSKIRMRVSERRDHVVCRGAGFDTGGVNPARIELDRLAYTVYRITHRAAQSRHYLYGTV